MEEIERRREKEEISGDVGISTYRTSLEAMSRNGISNLFDSEIRDLEVVAMSV